MPGTIVDAVWSAIGSADSVLTEVGLPRLEPLVRRITPRGVLTNKLGIPAPGDIAENFLHKLDVGVPKPRLPRF